LPVAAVQWATPLKSRIQDPVSGKGVNGHVP